MHTKSGIEGLRAVKVERLFERAAETVRKGL